MTTIINNPPSNDASEKGSGFGVVLGIIIVILLLAAFFVYGLPAIRGNGGASSPAPSTVNIGGDASIPTGGSGSGGGGGSSGGGY